MRLTEKKENGFYELKNGQEIYGEENGIRLVQIVGKKEDIEEELGIDLITLFKVLKNGFYRYRPTAINNVICFIAKPKVNMEQKCFTYGSYGKSYFKDYGKTWALTKEELEH